MRFTVSQEVLASMVEHVGAVVPARFDVPSLGALRLSVEGDRLTVEATGSDGGLSRAWADDVDGEDGVAFVRCEWMVAAVRALPRVDVTVRTDGTVMRVSAGGSRMTLRLMSDVTALEPHAKPDDPVVEFDVDEWRAALRLVKPVTRAAVVRSNPVLVGAHLAMAGGVLCVEACDMYRIARAAVSPVGGDGSIPAMDLICPAERLEVAGGAGRVALGFSNRTVTVETDSTLDTSILVDGVFPSVDGLMPDSCDSTVDLPVDEFRGALTRALMVAGSSSASLKIHAGDDGVDISLDNMVSEMSSSDVVYGELDGEPFTVLLDPRYVQHAVTVASGASVRLARRRGAKSVVFRDPEREGMLVAVVPKAF